MKFYLRQRRQPPAVIIVAMIDVLIVVLIFIMVTTTAKKPTVRQLKLVLPTSTTAPKSGANENPPFIISVEANGTFHTGPLNAIVTVDQLKRELMVEAARNPKVKVTLNEDEKAPIGATVKVMDAAKELNLTLFISVKGPAK